MFYLLYEIVTKKGECIITRHYPYKTKQMSSKILPIILKVVFTAFPDETFVYAKLYELAKE